MLRGQRLRIHELRMFNGLSTTIKHGLSRLQRSRCRAEECDMRQGSSSAAGQVRGDDESMS